MKRSEMLNKIKEIIDSYTAGSNYPPEYIAKLILTVCESNGMKPPKTAKCPVLFKDIQVWDKE